MDAAGHLAETRDGVLEAVRGLTDAQWRFKPAPDRWSALENVEHLVLVGRRVVEILGRLAQSQAAPVDRDFEAIDAFILKDALDRSKKFPTPPIINPTGDLSPADAIEQFSIGCAAIAERVKIGPALRRNLISHPIYGPLDGYQWILLYGAHNARHTEQIRELECATCS
jgi:hypothetical protein